MEQTDTSGMNIYQKLNEVRKLVPYLQKQDGGGLNYKAVRHDQVNEALRQGLIDFGIIAEPHLVKGKSRKTGKSTRSGIPYIRYEAVYDIVFVNMDDPKDRATVRVSGHGEDEGDKAPGKALSYAVKSAELKLFNISTGEDDEARVEAVPQKTSVEAERERQTVQAIRAGLLSGDSIVVGRLCYKHKDIMETIFTGTPKSGGAFTSSEKSELREMESKYHSMLDEWAEAVKEAVANQDEAGVNEIIGDMEDPADKNLLWARLSDTERAYIKALRDK